MAFIYPSSDFEKPALLTGLLGTFWANTYEGLPDIESFIATRTALESQTSQNLREAIGTTARHGMPVFHTKLWHQLILKESLMNERDFSIAKYGEGFIYGPQPSTEVTILYGDEANRDVFAFRIPEGVAQIPVICNRTDLPTTSWLDGLDYTLEDGYLKLVHNPFETAGLPIRDVIEGGVVVDREIGLWLFRSAWDLEYVWTHFGHILGIQLPSSEGYRDFVNAALDAAVDGGSLDSVAQILSAVADAPTVIEESEVVESITTDANHLVVVTDHHAYKYSRSAVASVAVGDTVHRGQFLCLAVQLYSPAHQEKPSWLAA